MKEAPLFSDIAEGPNNAKAFWTQSNDGVRLRVAMWYPDQSSKGTVFLMPGITGYIERSGRTATKLIKQGFTTFAIDWRGHGLSDAISENAKAAHAVSFLDYQNDVTAMVAAAEELDLPKPWHLLANSMGACIGLRAIIEGMPISSSIFVTPMWGIKMSAIQRCAAWPISWIFQILGKGQNYAPGYNDQPYVLKTDFLNNNLTSSPETYKHLRKLAKSLDDMQRGGPSMGWLHQGLLECRRLSKLPHPQTPSLVLRSSSDDIIDNAAIDARMESWSAGNLEIIQDSKHDMLMEIPNISDSVISKACNHFSRFN